MMASCEGRDDGSAMFGRINQAILGLRYAQPEIKPAHASSVFAESEVIWPVAAFDIDAIPLRFRFHHK
ncbi:hypothetical protein D7S86_08005 [Pararobbsia silviterrae]|uniref:Uncharacterized protein n=2 Tax=Pararobbsia silviterrae TaxID=1792498 RepID=A0A494YB27_9BURK|nr:hypothetical protein D7S86_08005 [Pararobbsia silviterrae]